MRFTIEIDAANSAFEDDTTRAIHYCLGRVVSAVAQDGGLRLDDVDRQGVIFDSNGNTVGNWYWRE